MNGTSLEPVLYGLCGMTLTFVIHFLWNLWLAPYRLIEQRLNEELSNREKDTFVTSTTRQREPKPANIALYHNHTTLLLYEAACLWVEIEPLTFPP